MFRRAEVKFIPMLYVKNVIGKISRRCVFTYGPYITIFNIYGNGAAQFYRAASSDRKERC